MRKGREVGRGLQVRWRWVGGSGVGSRGVGSSVGGEEYKGGKEDRHQTLLWLAGRRVVEWRVAEWVLMWHVKGIRRTTFRITSTSTTIDYPILSTHPPTPTQVPPYIPPHSASLHQPNPPHPSKPAPATLVQIM